jgi:hypothetical protein
MVARFVMLSFRMLMPVGGFFHPYFVQESMKCISTERLVIGPWRISILMSNRWPQEMELECSGNII